MGCLKSFGDRIMARDPDRQTAEIHTRVAWALLRKGEVYRDPAMAAA